MIDLGYPDFFNVEQKNLHALNVFYHFGFELFDYVKI
jgi:hypothetical protein